MNWLLPRMPEGDVRLYTGRELTELAEAAGYSALRPGRRARSAVRRAALTRALLQRRGELGSPRPRVSNCHATWANRGRVVTGSRHAESAVVATPRPR